MDLFVFGMPSVCSLSAMSLSTRSVLGCLPRARDERGAGHGTCLSGALSRGKSCVHRQLRSVLHVLSLRKGRWTEPWTPAQRSEDTEVTREFEPRHDVSLWWPRISRAVAVGWVMLEPK